MQCESRCFPGTEHTCAVKGGDSDPTHFSHSHKFICPEPINAVSLYNCNQGPDTFCELSLFCKNKYVLMGFKVHWPVDVSALF